MSDLGDMIGREVARQFFLICLAIAVVAGVLGVGGALIVLHLIR